MGKQEQDFVHVEVVTAEVTEATEKVQADLKVEDPNDGAAIIKKFTETK